MILRYGWGVDDEGVRPAPSLGDQLHAVLVVYGRALLLEGCCER